MFTHGLLTALQDVLRGLGVPSVSVVDFAGLTPTEQMRLASAADVVVMVHGGALANVLWLPRGAMLVDIYPYPFKVVTDSGMTVQLTSTVLILAACLKYMHQSVPNASAIHTPRLSVPDLPTLAVSV